MSASVSSPPGSTAKPIYAVTQFTGGVGAVWRGTTVPVPSGVITVETDTGIVKRGDGATLYPDLPVLFNVSYLQDIAQAAAAISQVATNAAQSAALAAAWAAGMAGLVDGASYSAKYYAQQAQNILQTLQNNPAVGSVVSATTTDTTVTPLSGMVGLPGGIAVQRIIGQITAQNTVTGDVVIWDIAALAVRKAVNAPIQLPTDPMISAYYTDTAMTGCGIVINTTASGLQILATGLVGATISWQGRLQLAGTPGV